MIPPTPSPNVAVPVTEPFTVSLILSLLQKRIRPFSSNHLVIQNDHPIHPLLPFPFFKRPLSKMWFRNQSRSLLEMVLVRLVRPPWFPQHLPVILMDCYVCGAKACGYPVCNACTREGYNINKILSGEQTPKTTKPSNQSTLKFTSKGSS